MKKVIFYKPAISDRILISISSDQGQGQRRKSVPVCPVRAITLRCVTHKLHVWYVGTSSDCLPSRNAKWRCVDTCDHPVCQLGSNDWH